MRPFSLFCIQSSEVPWLTVPSPSSLVLPAPRAAIHPSIIAVTVTLATGIELLDTAIANLAQAGNVDCESLKMLVGFRIFADQGG